MSRVSESELATLTEDVTAERQRLQRRQSEILGFEDKLDAEGESGKRQDKMQR